MFTKRIIPCLDVHNGRVVKGVNFVNLKDAGDPVEIAAAYDALGADELVFLDITASCNHLFQGIIIFCLNLCSIILQPAVISRVFNQPVFDDFTETGIKQTGI